MPGTVTVFHLIDYASLNVPRGEIVLVFTLCSGDRWECTGMGLRTAVDLNVSSVQLC